MALGVLDHASFSCRTLTCPDPGSSTPHRLPQEQNPYTGDRAAEGMPHHRVRRHPVAQRLRAGKNFSPRSAEIVKIPAQSWPNFCHMVEVDPGAGM
jgi:hypothetical protein